MKFTQFTLSLFTSILVFCGGCITPPDPLPASQGWRRLFAREYQKLDPAIAADYQKYIQELPLRERSQITEHSIHFFGNASGQHAVSFDIGKPALFGEVFWTHALIYDTNNKRIKVITRKTDRSVTI
jgi:hypothetical protein